MSNEQIATGETMNAAAYETKYLSNGRIVRVLARPAPNQIVVELGRTFGDDADEVDGDVFFDGNTRVVQEVYDKPPVDAIEASIRKLEANRSQLRASLSELMQQEELAKRRVAALKIYEPLARIEDFLAGKITHYVIYDGYHQDYPVPRISTPQAEISGNDRYGDLKLLCLYGSKDRTLEFKLSHYSDGSDGRSSHCFPCCSLEDAQTKAREILTASLAKYKVPEQSNCETGIRLLAAAKTLGVMVPGGFEEALRRCEIRIHEAEVARKSADLAKAHEQLNRVRASS